MLATNRLCYGMVCVTERIFGEFRQYLLALQCTSLVTLIRRARERLAYMEDNLQRVLKLVFLDHSSNLKKMDH